MQASLKLKEDGEVNLEGVEKTTTESLPPRRCFNLNEAQRSELFTYVDDPESSQFTSESVATQQIKRD